MITISGRRVFPKDHQLYVHPGEAPSLEDITIGLSRIPRFAGQTTIKYSVLQHTLVVSELVSKGAKIYALLHDAPEAIVADVPTPWKTESAKIYEEEIMRRICREHGIVWPAPPDLWDEVIRADSWALAAEAYALGYKAAEAFWPFSKWTSHEHEALHRTETWICLGEIMLKQYRNDIASARLTMRSDTRVQPQ